MSKQNCIRAVSGVIMYLRYDKHNNYRVYCIILLCVALICGCDDTAYITTESNYNTLQEVDTLQMQFQIGEELGDSTNTFYSIVDVDLDNTGRLFVLDGFDASVRTFDLQGNFLQQVTRRGAGPGELLRPRSLSFMPDGRLVISAPSKQGFVVFDDSLHFLEEIRLWNENSPYDLTAISDNRIALSRYDEDPSSDYIRHTVGLYSWGEPTWDTILWKDSLEIEASDESRDPSKSWIFCLFNLLETSTDNSGNIYFAPLDQFEYRVIAWDSTGNEILNLTRDFAPVEKTQGEINSEVVYMNSYYSSRAGQLPSFEFHPLPFKYMIEDVGIGPDENIWVRRGTRTDLFFDIYDRNGNLVRNAVYPLDSWTWETEITQYGIFAWELDPLEGYQKLYFVR